MLSSSSSWGPTIWNPEPWKCQSCEKSHFLGCNLQQNTHQMHPQAGGRQKSFLEDSSLCPHQQADEILCLILNCLSLTLQIWGWLAKLWFSGECGTSCLKARRVSSILRFPIGAPLKETCLWRGFISVREYYSSVMPIV